MTRARRYWLLAHTYVGLTVGLILAVIGLSGSLLVFNREADAWLNTQLLANSSATVISPQQSLEAAMAFRPNAPITRIILPREPGQPYELRYDMTVNNSPTFGSIYVNSASGLVTGERAWGSYAASWLYQMHISLFAGDFGKKLVGVTSVFLLFSAVSGIYLWWPRPAPEASSHLSRFKHSLSISARAGTLRFYREWHRFLGVLAALFLALSAVSGFALIFPQTAAQWVSSVASVSTAAKPVSKTGDSMMSVSDAIHTGSSVFPEATLTQIYLPTPKNTLYQLYYREAPDPRRIKGSSIVAINAADGSLTYQRQWKDMQAGDRFLTWQFPLHNGEGFGIAGRILVFITGLVLPALYITGILTWLRKRAR